MTRDTSSDSGDNFTDQLAALVREFQAVNRMLAQDHPEKQREALRQEQRKRLAALYVMLEEALRDEAVSLLDQIERHSHGQPVRPPVRNEVIRSLMHNRFTALVIALPKLDLDTQSDTRAQLLAAARASDSVPIDHGERQVLEVAPLPRQPKKITPEQS